MKLETFKAGTWKPRYQYKSFEPVLVDHAWLWEDPTGAARHRLYVFETYLELFVR